MENAITLHREDWNNIKDLLTPTQGMLVIDSLIAYAGGIEPCEEEMDKVTRAILRYAISHFKQDKENESNRANASRANGRKGGRPRKAKDTPVADSETYETQDAFSHTNNNSGAEESVIVTDSNTQVSEEKPEKPTGFQVFNPNSTPVLGFSKPVSSPNNTSNINSTNNINNINNSTIVHSTSTVHSTKVHSTNSTLQNIDNSTVHSTVPSTVLSTSTKDIYTVQNAYPSLSECEEYFVSKGDSEEHATRFYDYYSPRNWTDGKGKPVYNWRKVADKWIEGNVKKQYTAPTRFGPKRIVSEANYEQRSYEASTGMPDWMQEMYQQILAEQSDQEKQTEENSANSENVA